MAQLILLDTNVAGAVLANITSSSSTVREWFGCLSKLTAPVTDAELAIPTPVFFEISKRNAKSHVAISTLRAASVSGGLGTSALGTTPLGSPSVNPIFRYINHSITPDILASAAKFKLLCHKYVGKKPAENISDVDALLAAYCLNYGHYVATKNQTDFPVRYFDVVNVETAPIPTEDSSRESVYLLSPNVNKWSTDTLI